MVRIAQISCGSEYSGVQNEIEKAAHIVGGSIFTPEIEASEIRAAEEEIGFHVASPGLRVMMARAKAIVEGRVDADGVFIASCFRWRRGGASEERDKEVYPKPVEDTGCIILIHGEV